MGPFPHDAPRATITPDNPAGTDGFEFIEYAAPDPAAAGAGSSPSERRARPVSDPTTWSRSGMAKGFAVKASKTAAIRPCCPASRFWALMQMIGTRAAGP